MLFANLKYESAEDTYPLKSASLIQNRCDVFKAAFNITPAGRSSADSFQIAIFKRQLTDRFKTGLLA